MNIEALRAELANEQYAGLDDQQAADLLNARTIATHQSRFCSARTMLAELGPTVTEAILTALEAAKVAVPVLKRVLPWLSDPQTEGLDFGPTAATLAMIDQLAGGGVLTSDQATALKGLSAVTITRAEQLGLPTVYAGHVADARRS